ncbi:MAG: response regulator, partial [Treponema sp.]|nr:response regulator [Treponema sp.]
RGRRNISFPLDSSLFVSGTNILAFRIVGAPHFDITGLWYEKPYYIGDYGIIRKDHDESLILALCAVFLFVGLYHFYLFLYQPQYRYNLYYCFFSILLGLYFLMRSSAIYSIIPDSNITLRLEYASFYMLIFAQAIFLEHLNFGKTMILNRICGGLCVLCVIAQGIFSNPFGDDLLYVSWVIALFELVYIFCYDIAYVFCRDFRALWRAQEKPSLPKLLWASFTQTSIGNLLIGAVIIYSAVAYDLINSIYLRYGAINISGPALVLFTIVTTFILARRFDTLFRRIHETNTLLEKTNLNLEATVRERTRELELQTEVAQSASRAKSVFLARMSHEIRTPLNAILGLSEVELQDGLPGKTRLNLEKIYHSGSHLLGIVNDILDISKIESGNFEIFPGEYEFSGVINDAVQLNIVRIGSKPVEFKLELDETVPSKLYGDELRIRQILNNLLSNAFKYTEEGEVLLRIGWEQREGVAWIGFTVEDTGRGIKQEDMEKLFSEYTQFDTAANRRIEGTGLGLSISRGLLDMMGGSITAESEYGKGSVFRISLPQGIVDQTPIGREAADNLRNFRFIEDRNRSRGNSLIRSYMPYGKVLVVDDLETNLDVMTGLLMPYGLQVDTVLSGREAVERIRAEEVRYDLIFMDHMMPEMDGIEAIRIIREMGSSYARQVIVVALTANAVEGTKEMFLENGFNDFIAKPIDIKQLDMALNQWVRDTQSEETLREAENQERERKGEPGAAAGTGNESRWLLEHPVNGVDTGAALDLYGGAAALIPILRSFVTHTPGLISKMDGHLGSSLADYAVEVHGLKGTLNAICAGGTAELAKKLEFASKEGNWDIVRAGHGELRRQALELTEGLGRLLEEWEEQRPEEEKEGRAAPERELLVRLSAAAGSFNSNEIEEALGELERCRYEKDGDLIIWLREQAENFDYDAMHKRLEEFLKHGG